MVTEETVMAEELFLQAMQEKILGNTDKAITLFERIIKENDQNDAAYFQLSKLYQSLERQEDAFKSIQKSASIDPSNKHYQIILAEYYEKQQMFSAAASVYKQLYDNKIFNPDLLDNWIDVCIQANNYDQALIVINILEKKNGLIPSVAKKKYNVLMRQKKNKKAQKVFEELLEKNPENIEALYLIAMHHKQMGEADKSKAYFSKILKLDPDNSKANIALAEDFKKSGKDDQYLNSIQSIIQNPKIKVDLKIKEVIPYLEKQKSGQHSDLDNSLIHIAQDLITIHPDEAKVFALAGDIYYHAGQTDKAIENYAKAIELRPEIWSVWEHLFYLQAETNRETELIKWTTKAKDYYPNQALVYYMSAIGQAKLGNFQEALEEVEEATMMIGNNTQLKIDLFALRGTILYRLNDHNEAIKWLNEALALNPEHMPAISALAQAMLSNKEDSEAIESIIDKGLAIDKDYLPLIASKGRFFYVTSQYNEAKDWLVKALDEQGNTDTAMLEILGDTYFQLDQINQALEFWQKAIQLNSPNSSILQQKIETKSLIK